MEEDKRTIIERHTVETEPGIRKLDLVNILLELDARQKNVIALINELREVISGQAAWSKEVDERLQKLDPKIEIVSEYEANKILKK